VTALILKRFDKFNSERDGAPDPESANAIPSVEAPTTNGTKPIKSADTSENGSESVSKKRSPDDESALSELEQSPPRKKKQKKSKTVEDDDAAFAAKLQAEENLRSRARSTRGGNTKKRAPVVKKKKEKKKSANRIKDEDDSDIGSGSGSEKKSPKRTGGFHVSSLINVSRSRWTLTIGQKPMNLSPALSELLNETQLSRPQTVKKIWEYVKERDLQDPEDKRQIRCDEPLRAVFKQDRVHMFTMNKILSQNLYAIDE
jgi:upstream activation factor subunit UAF30